MSLGSKQTEILCLWNGKQPTLERHTWCRTRISSQYNLRLLLRGRRLYTSCQLSPSKLDWNDTLNHIIIESQSLSFKLPCPTKVGLIDTTSISSPSESNYLQRMKLLSSMLKRLPSTTLKATKSISYKIQVIYPILWTSLSMSTLLLWRRCVFVPLLCYFHLSSSASDHSSSCVWGEPLSMTGYDGWNMVLKDLGLFV